MRHVGRDEQNGRELYVSVVEDLASWSPALGTLRPFAAICALDAEAEEESALRAMASHLMACGCHYVCAWGLGCEWLHDVVDEVWSEENPASAQLRSDAWDPTFVMTTANDDMRLKGLDDSLWEVVFTSWVEEHEIGSVLAVTAPQYADHIEQRFADSAQLNHDVVYEDAYRAGDRYFTDECLDEFTGNAPNWDTEDLSIAKLLLAGQKRRLEETHPGDKKGRKRLQHVVKSLERAIANAGRD